MPQYIFQANFKQISRFQQEDDKQVEKHYLHYLAGTVILSSTVQTMSTSVENYQCIDVFK